MSRRLSGRLLFGLLLAASSFASATAFATLAAQSAPHALAQPKPAARPQAQAVQQALSGDKEVLAALAPFIEANELLARQLVGRAGLGARLEAARLERARLEQQLAELRAAHARVVARVAAAGTTESVGLLLWRERIKLAKDETLQDNLRRRQDQLNELQVRLLDFDEQGLDAEDGEARIAEQVGLLPTTWTAAERADFASGLRAIEAERVRLLAELGETGRQLFEELLDVEATERTLAVENASFRDYITARVLWLRSATPLDDVSPRTALQDGWDALRWLLHPRQWSGLAAALAADARSRPLIASGCLLLIALLIRLRWPVRRRIDEAARLASRHATDSFRHTLDALACTVLLALAWPALWWSLGWRLSVCAQGGDFEHAVGGALWRIAPMAFGLAFAHKLCRPTGLGEAHFHWPPGVARSLRWTVRLLALVWLPAIFVTAIMSEHRNEGWNESLGRLAFVLSSLAMAVILRRVLRMEGRIMTAVAVSERAGWTWRLRHVWRSALVLLPLAFALLALVGYYYTALALQVRLQQTLWLAIALSIAYALLLRWMTVARREMALAAVRARRHAAVPAHAPAHASIGTPRAAPHGAAAGESSSATTEPDEAQVELALVNDQTRRLLRAVLALALLLGVWAVWADVLPAFEVLNRVTLWHHESAVSQPMPMVDVTGRALLDAAGTPQMGMAPAQEAVTLVNLLAALLAAAMGIIAARNVPGLLELAVLRRLPIGTAGRYAARTIARYVLVVLSIVAVFGALGVAWGDIQWLAAAVTVGLGFGLQEIFANFVAGIIVLLERPIRVGDTVTVGGVTGEVTRIQMRATTISDWDRRELLVPNKEFITAQVVNWTLSDSTLRVVITVGVAYGSDTALVSRLLTRIAKREPLVLDEPPTTVLFTGFGDSTLNFELRVFVASPADFRAVRHDINVAIDNDFRAAGIEIAFPQRDLHIRSVPPEWGGLADGPPRALRQADAPRGAGASREGGRPRDAEPPAGGEATSRDPLD